MVVKGDDDDDQLLLAEKLSKGEDIKIPLKRHVRVSVLLHDMLLWFARFLSRMFIILGGPLKGIVIQTSLVAR